MHVLLGMYILIKLKFLKFHVIIHKSISKISIFIDNQMTEVINAASTIIVFIYLLYIKRVISRLKRFLTKFFG